MSTYRRIAAVELTTRILNTLADQRQPASGKTIAGAVGEAHGTVMCHLVTLEDAGYVQRVGDHFELGTKLALHWARKKSQVEGRISRDTETLRQLEG